MHSKIITRAATGTRALSLPFAARASSAGPSTDGSASPGSASPKSPINSALRSLVDLHHTSTSFLHDPSQIPTGFETAFRHTSAPSFRSYAEWSRDVLELRSARGQGGIENLSLRASGESVGGYRKDGENAKIQGSRMVKKVWKGKEGQNWSDSAFESTTSEREKRIKEALYGTWERAGAGRVEPALDGVVELLEAKGVSVEEYARQWAERDTESEDARR